MEILDFPVDVYFNLHRKVWSLRNRKTGVVERHARAVIFPYGAAMVVQAAGRARTLQTGQKCVHAFARGEGVQISPDPDNWDAFAKGVKGARRITYNPRKADHFTESATGKRVDHVSALVMIATQGAPPHVWAVIP